MSATPAERKALLFLATVALLGAGVRLWRSSHPDRAQHAVHVSGASDTSARARGSSRSRTRSSRGRSTARASVRVRSRTGQSDRDSTSIIDLDRASVAEIDALGLLAPGVARLIVADRDTFGPFGSLHELSRVPFLTSAALRQLAPRVTFSRLPRPKNAVVQPRRAVESSVVPAPSRSMSQRARSHGSSDVIPGPRRRRRRST